MEEHAYFMCLQRRGASVSGWEPLSVCGGSMTIDEGERSAVLRNLNMNAWPPA